MSHTPTELRFAEHLQRLLRSDEAHKSFNIWLQGNADLLSNQFQRQPSPPSRKRGRISDFDFIRWAWLMFVLRDYQQTAEVKAQCLPAGLLDLEHEEPIPEIEYLADGPLAFYATADLAEVQAYELRRLSRLHRWLDNEGCLCGTTGREIIAEFGFRGHLELILFQLDGVLRHFREAEFGEEHRFDCIERRRELVKYNYLFRTGIAKLYTNETNKPGVPIQRFLFERRLHRARQCLCYANGLGIEP